MNFRWCFCAVLSIIHVYQNTVSAAPYEIPTDLVFNKFTENLLRLVLEYINNGSDDLYLIFDVPKAQSKLHRTIEYEFDIILTSHQCKNHPKATNLKFAECEKITEDFKFCKVIVNFAPWIRERDHFIIDSSTCQTIAPVLPKNPYFLGYSVPSNADELFTAFRQKYRRFYSSNDFKHRFRIFKRNLLKIQLLQALDRDGAQYGITAFSDLDEHEFRTTHANLKENKPLFSQPKFISTDDKPNMPNSFDWREKGAVTEVKDQGWCGSCWAFGTVGNIETQWFLKNGTLESLSEQQLLDCDKKDEACNGGLPEWAFPAIIEMGGLMSEKNYPYKAHQENVCHLVKNNVSARIDDWAQLPQDEKKLAAWLAQNGTITVGINANFLQFYFGGISHPPHFLCSDKGLDHAVLLVGYGVSSVLSRPYWIVKNSWGAGWGESGYFRLYRGDGTCGINADATTSIIY